MTNGLLIRPAAARDSAAWAEMWRGPRAPANDEAIPTSRLPVRSPPWPRLHARRTTRCAMPIKKRPHLESTDDWRQLSPWVESLEQHSYEAPRPCVLVGYSRRLMRYSCQTR